MEFIPSCFIIHPAKHDWGYSILFMLQTGGAFARLYWYEDDDKNVYLDMLSVIPDIQNHGWGKLLQQVRENVGRALGFQKSNLWVKKDTWMHEWYIRRGYSDMCDHESEPDSIWMTKDLNPEKS